jgi:hypothetical protein
VRWWLERIDLSYVRKESGRKKGRKRKEEGTVY